MSYRNYMTGTTRPRQIAQLSGDEPTADAPSTGIVADGGPSDDPNASKGQPQQSLGFWLDAPEDQVAKDIDQRWNAQNRPMKNRFARWDLNERRLEGDTYSKLVHDTDRDTFRIYTPENAELAPPSLNKTRDLANKMVANLLVDPPKFEAEPPSDTDEDVAAAEFSTRALENETGETGLDLVGKLEEAEDLACSYGSGFLRFYVDPTGGGRRPKEIYASTQAQTADTALFVDGDAKTQPQPDPYVIRYVMPDGTLTDDPSQADIEWLPKIKCEVLTGRHVRFLPETAQNIEDADGMLVASYTTVADLKKRFPQVVESMSDDQMQKLVSYRPVDTRKLLPKWAGDGQGTRKPGETGVPDNAMALVITGYLRGCPDYPKGAYVCMAGGQFILERLPWETELAVETGTGKGAKPIPMDVPIAQVRQFRDAKGQDPYGRGLVDLVGDGDPIRSFIMGSVIEYLHRVNNPHIFVPVGSVHENYIGLPRGTPIPYNPSAGGKPEYEQMNSLPGEFLEVYQEIGSEQDSTSGLQEAAQGTSDPNSQSGVAKQIVVEQALVALGKPKRALDKAGIRSCRIILQLMRQAYTTPTRIRVPGEDGAYKEQEWTAADLRSTVDVRILPGTSTMLPASAKQDLILRYAAPINPSDPNSPAIISVTEAQRLIRTGVRAIVGMQDSPALLRVKSQIKRFKDGPPAGWAPQPPPPPQIDPVSGQPVPPPPQAPDPANPFADQRPTDDEPDTAKVRHAELADLVSSNTLMKFGPQWAQFALQEYARCKGSAGIQTIAEQQQAQAQATQQQQAAQAQADQQKVQQQASADVQRQQNEAQIKDQQRQAEQAHEQDMEAMRQQGAAHREAARMNAQGTAQGPGGM